MNFGVSLPCDLTKFLWRFVVRKATKASLDLTGRSDSERLRKKSQSQSGMERRSRIDPKCMDRTEAPPQIGVSRRDTKRTLFGNFFG